MSARYRRQKVERPGNASTPSRSTFHSVGAGIPRQECLCNVQVTGRGSPPGPSLCAHAQSLSPVPPFVTPWTAARQAPLPMEFPRQEYWSRLPFPPPEDLPDPGIEPTSPALAGRFFTTEPAGKPSLKPAEKPLLLTKTSPTKVLDRVSLSPTSVPLPPQSGLAWPPDHLASNSHPKTMNFFPGPSFEFPRKGFGPSGVRGPALPKPWWAKKLGSSAEWPPRTIYPQKSRAVR